MNAIAYASCGLREVLQLQEVAIPTPKNNEVLIRIRATTATAADCQLRSSKAPTAFSLFGLKQPGPIILGQELAGEIEAVGRKVTRFRKGDQVIGWSGLRLGTYAVQIAKHFGAEVTGVDSTAKLNLLRLIGADHVVDYTQEDFTQSSKPYDVIFDVIGKSSLSSIMDRLNLHGRYLTAVPQMSQIIRSQWSVLRSGKRVIFWAPSAVVPTQARKLLSHFDERSQHYEIVDERSGEL